MSKLNNYKFVKKIALCDILSNTTYKNQEKYRSCIQDIVSMNSPKKKKSIWNVVLAFFKYFSHWSNVGLMSLMILLLSVCLSSLFLTWSYFQQQKNRPDLTHVLISDSAFKNNTLNRINIDKLKKNELIEDIMGRYTRLSTKIKTKQSSFDYITFNLTAVDFNERLIQDLSFYKISDNSTLSNIKYNQKGKKIKNVFTDLKDNEILVTKKLMEKLLESSYKDDSKNLIDKPLINQVSVYLNSDWHDFNIEGVVESLPEDRDYILDGLTSHHNFENIIPLNITEENINNTSIYQRVAIYYKFENFEKLADELDAKGYKFSRDNFNKLGEVYGLSASIFSILFFIISLVVFITVIIIRVVFSYYIDQNKLPFAVMKSAGAELPLYRKLIYTLLYYDLLISVVISAFLITILVGVMYRFESAKFLFQENSILYILYLFLFSMFFILFIGKVIVNRLIKKWWNNNEYPADALKSS